jgi:hypothetical protein
MIDRHQPLIVSVYAKIPLVNRRWGGKKMVCRALGNNADMDGES